MTISVLLIAKQVTQRRVFPFFSLVSHGIRASIRDLITLPIAEHFTSLADLVFSLPSVSILAQTTLFSVNVIHNSDARQLFQFLQVNPLLVIIHETHAAHSRFFPRFNVSRPI